MINPKIISSKEEKKDKILSLIENSYEKLKQCKIELDKKENIFFDFYFTFAKEEILTAHQSNQDNRNIKCKIYTIFPNCNFELKQVKNLPLSNTRLNQYLVNKTNEELSEESLYRNGFFAMSQNHRLIALKDDTIGKGGIKSSQCLKQILFGIWLNLKEENPSQKKNDLDTLLEKYKYYIYEKCLEFVQLTSKIETVYSPSPDQGIFILVIFYQNMQCHYEVKILPNEEEKFEYKENARVLSKYSNNWLIAKSKFFFNRNDSIKYSFIKEILNSRILNISEYLEKKTGINQKSFLTESINNNKLQDENLQDCVMGFFENSNLELNTQSNENYNLPLPINQFNSNKFDSINSHKTNLNINNYQNNNQIFEDNNSKKQNEISHASTNSHSLKQSTISLEKNLQQNNNNKINENLTEILMEQGKMIEKLQNQVTNLEINIKGILNELLMKPIKKKVKSNNKKGEKNRKNNFKESTGENLLKSNKGNIQNDESFQIPKIIYEDSLFNSDDE